MLSLPSTRIALAGAVVLFLASCVGLAATGIELDPRDLWSLVVVASAAAGVIVVCRLAASMLHDDQALPARLIKAGAERLMIATTAFAALALMTAPCALLSYLSLATSLPLQDQAMVAFDRSLGIEWESVVSFVNDNALLREILAAAYRSLIPEAVAIIYLLALCGRTGALSEFLALFAVTSIATCVISGLIPTEGAYFFLKPAPSIYANLDPSGGLVHHSVLTALREGTFGPFQLSDVKGLVTFPSFHTSLAIVIAYCGARIRFVGPALIGLNALIVASTLAEGGHYFADVVGGAAVAAGAILFVRWVKAREADPSRFVPGGRPLLSQG